MLDKLMKVGGTIALVVVLMIAMSDAMVMLECNNKGKISTIFGTDYICIKIVEGEPTPINLDAE